MARRKRNKNIRIALEAANISLLEIKRRRALQPLIDFCQSMGMKDETIMELCHFRRLQKQNPEWSDWIIMKILVYKDQNLSIRDKKALVKEVRGANVLVFSIAITRNEMSSSDLFEILIKIDVAGQRLEWFVVKILIYHKMSSQQRFRIITKKLRRNPEHFSEALEKCDIESHHRESLRNSIGTGSDEGKQESAGYFS